MKLVKLEYSQGKNFFINPEAIRKIEPSRRGFTRIDYINGNFVTVKGYIEEILKLLTDNSVEEENERLRIQNIMKVCEEGMADFTIDQLKQDIERLQQEKSQQECYTVFDYDHIEYAGNDLEEAEKHLKGSSKVGRWIDGKKQY